MIKQKRGAAVLVMFQAAELVLLGIAILCLVLIMFKLSETSYEKNFMARDLALLIDTIYASPGELEYTYDMKGYKFDLEIKDGYVNVYDSGFKSPQSYRFAEKEDIEIEDFRTPAGAPSAVKFVKKGDKIKIEALYLS